MDALDRVAQVVVRLGDRVIVEHPTFPPLLDLLDELGADVIGVDLDDEGPIVAQFVEALAPATRSPSSCNRGPTTRPASRRHRRRMNVLGHRARGQQRAS